MATVVPKKRGGRPPLLAPDMRLRISELYFDEGWTATRIEQELVPGMEHGTIRKIAQAEKQKAADSDKSCGLKNPIEADPNSTLVDDTASAKGCETLPPIGGARDE